MYFILRIPHFYVDILLFLLSLCVISGPEVCVNCPFMRTTASEYFALVFLLVSMFIFVLSSKLMMK